MLLMSNSATSVGVKFAMVINLACDIIKQSTHIVNKISISNPGVGCYIYITPIRAILIILNYNMSIITFST